MNLVKRPAVSVCEAPFRVRAGDLDGLDLARLPADVYSISSAPLRPHLADVVWPALVAFGISLLATLYPALQAARARPAEALRYE